MMSRWLLLAILVAMAKDAAEMSQEQQTPVADVVIAETSSGPYDHHETVVDTSTSVVDTSTSVVDTSTSVVDTSTSVVDTSTSAVDTSLSTKTNVKETNTVDELRNRVVQQTDELSKANAALSIAQQHEQQMAILEREKYGYLKTTENKMLCLMGNVPYTERGLSDDLSLIQHGSTCRTFEQSGRRMQVIRRLLAGAELGLVQMQSVKKLSASNTDRRKK